MADVTKSGKLPIFKPSKDSEILWPSFNGGLNTLYRPTELRPNELAQADNIMMTGAGTPTGRWGSVMYDWVGTKRVRMLDAYYNSNPSTNQLLAITDAGYLVKQSGASYSIVSGGSFLSGYPAQSVEFNYNTYIANQGTAFTRYNGSTLQPYIGLAAPTNLSAAWQSGMTGYNTYSWKVTALSSVGETAAGSYVSLGNLPLSMTSTFVKVTWNQVSLANATLVGYNIYRGTIGSESLLASLDPSTTSFIDLGQPTADNVLPPLVDSTAGPKAKYMIKVGDRLVLAGIPSDPSLLLVSGVYPFNDRFNAYDGGAYVYVSPNDGEDITGIGLQHLQTSIPVIIVYKRRSTYVVTMNTVPIGNYQVLDLETHPLTYTFGTSSGETAIPVENDYFAFGRKGLYSTGQEPQFLNAIRTNEISARIRPYVQSLSESDLSEAVAGYIDYKYLLSFPTRKETIVYDYQRACFYGPWKTPFGITKWLKYYDTSGNENWLAGADDGNIYSFSTAYESDNGTSIDKTLRTSKADFGLFEQMKMLKQIYFLFRNCRGQTNVNLLIEGRDG
ncbi:MAG: hypothetical protein KGJ90_07180, partial [Patescibacteria group bacterium]|nr:hypothetical protein [Patescibacteria group bacterium]